MTKKEGRYRRIVSQLEELLLKTDNPLSRMATINAVLHYKMDGFFWTGFYLITNGELMVGPYQGPVACQVLEKDKGVCWAAINQNKTIIVPDVEKFPGHIACDSRSRSEIAVPVRDTAGKVTAVLDVDSRELECFDDTDAFYLEMISGLLRQAQAPAGSKRASRDMPLRS